MGFVRFEHEDAGGATKKAGAKRTEGASSSVWTTEQNLLARGFIRHVENALALRRTERWLDAAEAARSNTRASAVASGLVLAGRCEQCQRIFPLDTERCDKDGGAIVEMWDLPTKLAGRYALRRRLGHGGMGAVFEARDETFERPVAVKVANPALHFSDSVRERFHREGRVLAAITHENVVQVLDAGRTEFGHLFLVMELLRGPDLDSMIKMHGRGAPNQVARFLREAAEALAAVHAAGLVHRDVKPSNFMLLPGRRGLHAKLVDFGVAREHGDSRELTFTGQIIGTPRYLAPETILTGEVSAASDLFSLALVTFAALTGRALIDATGPVEAIRAATSLSPSDWAERLPSDELVPHFAAGLEVKVEERADDLLVWAEGLASAIERSPHPRDAVGWPTSFSGLSYDTGTTAAADITEDLSVANPTPTA